MLLNLIKAFLKSVTPSHQKTGACTFSQARPTAQSFCPAHLILKFAIVVIAYYLTARLGVLVPYKESIVTLLWLPSGIAVGAIMRWGKVSVFATFTAAYFLERGLGLEVSTSLVVALGNTLAPLTAAYCLAHFKVQGLYFSPQLNRQVDILLMIAFALIGMSISALVGVSALFLSGVIQIDALAKLWLIWWMGDSIGVLLALPLILNLRKIVLRISMQKIAQATVWLILFTLCELLILNSVQDVNKQFMLSVFLILPLLIWVAMHFGVVGGSIVVISLSVVVVWMTSIGYGDLYSIDKHEGIFSLWLFILSLVVVMLLISSLQAERNTATSALRSNERKFRAVIDGALDGIVTIDALGNIVEFNPAAERIFGYEKAAVIGKSLGEMIVPKNQRKAHTDKHGAYVKSGEKHIFDQRLELTAMRADGSEFPVELTITALKGDEENPDGLVTGFIRDISAQKRAQQEVEKMLFYDMLTGLANRRLLMERFERARLNATRMQKYYALMFIDLDHFKLLNDTKGHDAGDLLLKELARSLQLTLRASDTLARLSGDEFVVVLENLDADALIAKNQVVEVAQKLLDSISKPFNLNGYPFNTTGSIGITLIEADTLSFEDHLRHADTAMYLAKSRGRNTYCFYDAATQSMVDRQLLIESTLKDALTNTELSLHFQAIVDSNQTITSTEALLRWHSRILGQVSPAEFIPVAEKSGQIVAIGDWVLKMAMAQLKAWQTNVDCQHLILSVNISAKQLLREDFVDKLRDLIAAYEINPNLLRLELTETATIDHIDEAIAKFKILRSIGIRIALDDFGTGQSSLVLIKKLPISQLKIDISFVADMLSDSNDAAIVKMIIAIAKTIGANVVAEGVETRAQFDALKKDGCEFFQGYYFAKPVALDVFEKMLSK